MKYCLSRLFIRNFSTYGKSINKFKNVSSKININPPSIPKDIYSEDKELEDKTPPKPGEYYPLEEINSKGLAMQLGRDEMYNRDPVSAYYTLKIKDTMYHVFNAARMVI